MTPRPYAADTAVPVERSKGEIEKLLSRHGAATFLSGWEAGRAYIAFEMQGRRVRFILPMPKPEDLRTTKTGARRPAYQQKAAHEQAIRQRWRALYLVIRAKLEAVQSGITTFEDEFLAHILLPGGRQTVGDWMRPQLASSYQSGRQPELLPAPEVPR